MDKTHALDAFGCLLVKALRKHGWPADYYPDYGEWTVFVRHRFHDNQWPEDFRRAVEIAVRVTARTHRVDVVQSGGAVTMMHNYRVHPTSGYFSKG